MTRPLRPVAQLLVDSVRAPAGLSVSGFDPALARTGVREVAAAALLHRVSPAVSCRVERLAGVPEGWREELRLYRHAQLARHLQARTDLALLQRALDDAGVRWVAAKGPVASELTWPRPDLREYFDLDLVVDRRQWRTALRALEGIGCTYVDRNWPLLRETMRAELAMAAPYGTPLDVHWDIAVPEGLRRAFRIDIAAMLERRREALLPGDVRTWVFDPADTVLHLAFHAAQAGAGRLVWSADVWFAARALTEADWTALRERARAYGVELPVALLLARMLDLLGPPPGFDPDLVGPARGLWGRLVRRRDRSYPQPGLPGDSHLGGTLYSSARATLPASLHDAVASRWRLRGLERPGRTAETESAALARDVPDPAARTSYEDRVEHAGRP